MAERGQGDPGAHDPLLETPRLSLQPIGEADAEFICRLMNEPSFLRFVGDRGIRTPDQARTYLREGPLAQFRRLGFGMWRVGLRPDRTPLGICSLVKRKGLDDIDIGFAFLPEFWGRGYASEAAAAVLEYARAKLGIARIVGVVTPDNSASIRVLEKLGLEFEGTVRLAGEGVELSLFASDR